MLSELLTAAEVARRLHLRLDRVYQLVAVGELEAVRIGPNTLRFTPQALERFVETHAAR
ncbi:MAG: helix-turn-helix domain-containing protein [Actinomycetota bacterium]